MRDLGPISLKPEAQSPTEGVRHREKTEALRWRSVFENSAIGVALADLNGRVLSTNSTYQKMLGYSESEFRELSFLEITHEDYH
jgi:PAS domain S-box-containing protein